MIGDDVEVIVLSVYGDRVRLGIQAPEDIPVHRTEIYLELQQGREREGQPRPDVGPEAGDPPRKREGPKPNGA